MAQNISAASSAMEIRYFTTGIAFGLPSIPSFPAEASMSSALRGEASDVLPTFCFSRSGPSVRASGLRSVIIGLFSSSHPPRQPNQRSSCGPLTHQLSVWLPKDIPEQEEQDWGTGKSDSGSPGWFPAFLIVYLGQNRCSSSLYPSASFFRGGKR
jgi:hypothetical protein